MVVPRLVGQALAGEPLTVYGDGGRRAASATWPTWWRRCTSCSTARARGARSSTSAPPSEISILELARRIIEIDRVESEIRLVPYDQAYGTGFEDMYRRVPDIDKLLR